jgi:hypothetical protein
MLISPGARSLLKFISSVVQFHKQYPARPTTRIILWWITFWTQHTNDINTQDTRDYSKFLFVTHKPFIVPHDLFEFFTINVLVLRFIIDFPNGAHWENYTITPTHIDSEFNFRRIHKLTICIFTHQRNLLKFIFLSFCLCLAYQSILVIQSDHAAASTRSRRFALMINSSSHGVSSIRLNLILEHCAITGQMLKIWI